MEEQIEKTENMAQSMEGEGPAPGDAPRGAESSVRPESPPRAYSTIHGSAGNQLLTLAIIALAVILLMLAVWVGEPA